MNKKQYEELLINLNEFKDMINKFKPTYNISELLKEDFIDSLDSEIEQVKLFIKIK